MYLNLTFVDNSLPFSGGVSLGHMIGTHDLSFWKVSPSLVPVSDDSMKYPAVPFCVNNSNPLLHPHE